MAAPFSIAVEGLTEFRRALRSISADMPKLLRVTLKAAVERAAEQARGEYSAFWRGPGSGRGRRTVNTIKAQATQSSAGVQGGGALYPWFAGQEFGSNKRMQFKPWTGPGPGGKGSAGRAIFPAVRDQAEPVVSDLEEGFEALARRAYPGA